MYNKAMSNALLPVTVPNNRGLQNPFSAIIATPEQSHNLLNFRDIGTAEYEQYVKFHILQQPSTTHPPVRKHKLLTMAAPREGKKR